MSLRSLFGEEELPEVSLPVDFENDPYFASLTRSWLRDRSQCIAPLRNQRETNSCYAFNVCDAAFAEYRLSTEDNRNGLGNTTPFAPQEVIDYIDGMHKPSDATKKNFPGVENAERGYPKSISKGFKYLKKYGVCRESMYPFKARVNQKKLPPRNFPRFSVRDYGRIKKMRDLFPHLDRRPVIIGLPVVTSLAEHEEGIYEGPNLNEWKEIGLKKENNAQVYKHSFLLCGWGTEAGVGYFLAKGCWGTDHGHLGFIKLSRPLVKLFVEKNDPIKKNVVSLYYCDGVEEMVP